MEKVVMISERQAAKMIGVHASTLLRWRNEGFIPVHYIEKKYVKGNIRINYPKEEFLNWTKSFQVD
jgi:predicted site-specific integrase-resolvase